MRSVPPGGPPETWRMHVIGSAHCHKSANCVMSCLPSSNASWLAARLSPGQTAAHLLNETPLRRETPEPDPPPTPAPASGNRWAGISLPFTCFKCAGLGMPRGECSTDQHPASHYWILLGGRPVGATALLALARLRTETGSALAEGTMGPNLARFDKWLHALAKSGMHIFAASIQQLTQAAFPGHHARHSGPLGTPFVSSGPDLGWGFRNEREMANAVWPS